MDGDLLAALIALALGLAGMYVAYRAGRNARREAQHGRFEAFYEKLAEADDSAIRNVLRLDTDCGLKPREQVLLIWYLTICEGVFHGKRYKHVENVYVDTFMASLKVKYADNAAVAALLHSEGFDPDFCEQIGHGFGQRREARA